MYYLSNISNTDSQNWIFTASTKVCTIRNFTTIASQSKNHKAFQNWYQLSSAQCAHSVRISAARAQREARAHLIINQPVRSRWKWPHGSRSPFSFFFQEVSEKFLPYFFYVVWHWPFRHTVVRRVYLENKYNYILKVVATFRVGLSRIKYCVELLYLYKVTTARWAASEFSLLIVTNLISQRPMTN